MGTSSGWSQGCAPWRGAGRREAWAKGGDERVGRSVWLWTKAVVLGSDRPIGLRPRRLPLRLVLGDSTEFTPTTVPGYLCATPLSR